MARTNMLQARLTDDEAGLLDRYMERHKLKTQSEAVRRMLRSSEESWTHEQMALVIARQITESLQRPLLEALGASLIEASNRLTVDADRLAEVVAERLTLNWRVEESPIETELDTLADSLVRATERARAKKQL